MRLPCLCTSSSRKSNYLWSFTKNQFIMHSTAQHSNPVSGDGVHDYLTYAGDEGGCLAPTDMQFYTQGTYDLAMIVRNTYVPTKDLASCTVIGDLPLGSGNQFHWVTYRYGKLAKTQH